MSNVILELEKKGLAHPPKWLGCNTQYLTIMGSFSYGVSSDTSDCDIYGFAIPPREELFGHLRGEIEGFGTHKERFKKYEEQHVIDRCAQSGKGKSYDLGVYNIVDYFQLLIQGNPHVLNSIFTPTFCVLHITKIGQMVRENRKLFLHKGIWHKFKGYAYSSMNKAVNKKERSDMKPVVEFEQANNLSKDIRLPDLEAEITKRNLWQKVKENTSLWEEYQSLVRKSSEIDLPTVMEQ